ncbi:MAG: LysM peptidoglycan-binding domain-containing protein [Halothece sp.]
MSIKLTCPVCDRPEIEGNICPNCETDLSTIRFLSQLPAESPQKKQSQAKKPLLLITTALICLVIGISLGTVYNSGLFAQKQPNPQLTSSENTVAQRLPEETKTPVIMSLDPPQATASDCGGFYYQVRRGDTLSKIANQFYGDSNYQFKIIDINPFLKGRENEIETGEKLLIPNRQENCQ